MKNRMFQVILIVLCVSAFFIVKENIVSNKNPFERLEKGPNRVTYSNWEEGVGEVEYKHSSSNHEIENRNLIIDYLKSLEYKRLSDGQKKMSLASQYVNEEYWFEYYRTVKTGDYSSEVISERIMIDYIVENKEKYFTIRSDLKTVKSGTYKIISDFDNNEIIKLLKD